MQALAAMSSGNNATAANQVTGNLTQAMNQLASMNSYVLFSAPSCRLETDSGLGARRPSPAVQSMVKKAKQIMNNVAKAGKALEQNCGGA